MVEDAFGSVGRVGDEHGGVLGRTDNVGQCDTGFVLRAESGLDRVRTVVDTDDVAHDFFSSVLCSVKTQKLRFFVVFFALSGKQIHSDI